MSRGDPILLPVNLWFIVLSLCFAFFWNLLPWGGRYGVPDVLALVLVFWNVHQPHKVSIGVAFLMGILVDVHHASLLGENALAYTLLSYFAITLHRRILWFSIWAQAFHIGLLIFLMHCVQVLAHLMLDGKGMSGWVLLEVALSILLWPLLSWILLAPQRRVIDRDDTRPL
jgi:rod shape-determining protein MreD